MGFQGSLHRPFHLCRHEKDSICLRLFLISNSWTSFLFSLSLSHSVWSVPLQRRFVASSVSCGCCLMLMFWAVVLLVPFFLAYTSESFWLKTSDYLEFPRAEFKYQALLVATGTDINDQPITMTFSTSPELRRGILSSTVRPASLRTYTDDNNLDRAPEAVHLDFELPLQTGERVFGVSALLMFQMELNLRAKVKLEGAAYVDYSSAVPGASLYVDGDLMLVQKNALPVTGGYSEPYKTSPLLGNSTYSPESMSDLLLPVLLNRYRSRMFISLAFLSICYHNSCSMCTREMFEMFELTVFSFVLSFSIR